MFLNSINILKYKAVLREFERKFPSISVEYCISTWIKNWKEKVVRAWINQYSHFDNTITFFIEGCYANIKKYLNFSTIDLKYIYESLELYWTKWYTNYKTQLE